MKIIHIQNGMGPAGNAAYRLHTAMRNNGIESSVLTLNPCSNSSYVEALAQGKFSVLRKIINSIWSRLALNGKIKDSYYFRCLPIIGRKVFNHRLVREANVIYVHWVAGVLSTKDLEGLAITGKPVIFFMHDMWDFTGGCHHSFDCKQYISGCKNCPMFTKNKQTAKKQIVKLGNIYSKYKNIFFVSPSEWMADCAKQSFSIPSDRVCSIPNLVDNAIFKAIDKKLAKSILNLPINKKTVTFGCQSGTNNAFKGWRYLQEAINKIERDDLQILVYGSDYNKETQEQVKYPITFLGPILDEHKLALICNATDVYVSPSLAESFGLTFLENILCGTPVVGFNNTAIPEIVKSSVTGYLAQNKSADDLGRGILSLLEDPFEPHLDIHYTPQNIISQHIDLIEHIQK